MWHVSSRSGVATLRTPIHLLLTYFLFPSLSLSLSPPLPHLLSPSLPLEVGPKIQQLGLGERYKLPQPFWDGATAEIEFRAFRP